MNAWRVYIASWEAERLERIIAFDPGFFVIGSSRCGLTALREIGWLCPDLAILDGELPGVDELSALRALEKMITPPRLLYLRRTGPAETAVCADRMLCDPWTEEALLAAAHAAAEQPLPRLAASRESERLTIAGDLLDELNVSPRLKGRGFIQCAAAALACAPQLAASYSERLYPFVAVRFQTSPQAVERAVRTAVEHTWLHGNLPAIQALFGLSVDAERGKPTNAECLSMLAEHVRLRLGRRA